MTPHEFGKKLIVYFGEWKEEEHKRMVWEFVKTKSTQYLDAMYRMLVESRPPNFGAPSLFDIKERHEEACNRMDFSKGMPEVVMEERRMLEGPPEERAQEKYFDADPNIKKLREKWAADKDKKDNTPLVYHRATPAFPWLDGIRGDEKVSISPEFYEEVSMAERMSRYCARRKGKA